MALQPDGKIVVAGTGAVSSNDDMALVRYESDGALDTTFGTGGKVRTEVSSGQDDFGTDVRIVAEGRILVGGYSRILNASGWEFSLARYNANGALDGTFDGDGRLMVGFGPDDFAFALAVQPDGKYVAAGSAQAPNDNVEFALIRLRGDVSNSPPLARAGGPYAMDERGFVTLDATGSTDPDQSTASLLYA